MTKNLNPESKENNQKAWEAFMEEFVDESDRAVAILGGAYLDVLLGQMINNFLIDDDRAKRSLLDPDTPYAPLSSFSARIRAAYCLGLIDRVQYKDLLTIKKVRNLFAHSLHGLSFQHDLIAKECKKLKIHLMFPLRELDIRMIFVVSIAILSVDIKIYGREVLSERRTTPDYYGFIERGDVFYSD